MSMLDEQLIGWSMLKWVEIYFTSRK